MAKSQGQIGYGIIVSYWDVSLSPDAYTELAELVDTTGFGVNIPEVDFTHMQSPNTARERKRGLKDGKQTTLKMILTAASLASVEYLIAQSDPVDFKFAFPAPLSKNRFVGAVPTDYEYQGMVPDGRLEISLQVRLSGDISSTDPHA